MKNKLTLILMLAMPYTVMTMDSSLKEDIRIQLQQLKKLLTKSNDAYIQNSTPMYEQWLTLHWFLLFRQFQGEYAYNSEILLREAKKLADVISAMEELNKSDLNYDFQVIKLIKMLISSNEAYIHSTPMHEQYLNLQWFLAFRAMQGSHYYNAEMTLNESKNLVDVITAMTKFKNN